MDHFLQKNAYVHQISDSTPSILQIPPEANLGKDTRLTTSKLLPLLHHTYGDTTFPTGDVTWPQSWAETINRVNGTKLKMTQMPLKTPNHPLHQKSGLSRCQER